MDPKASPNKMAPLLVGYGPALLRIRGLLGGLAVLLVISTARAETAPLVGSWWDARGDAVTNDQALDRLRDVPVILLGEVHDSEAIHRRQVQLFDSFEGPLVLALEQLDRGGKGRIDRLNAGSFEDGRARAHAGDFDFEGWEWKHYGLLFDWATEHGVPLWPLNLSREKAMAVAMADDTGWRDELDASERSWIDAVAPELSLPDAQQRELVEVLEQSHCQAIPSAMSSRMVRAQVARDVLMAEAIMAARESFPTHQVVAVMGNQHARLDRGVGYWLQQLPDGQRPEVISVGMLPKNNVANVPGRTQAFDLRLLMPPIEREDPCGGR